ncbi:Pre-mRNA-processing protein 40C [Platanthera guangdongensis]|uniref:Pre-mRNA-processing protein 40C n=1 Tax=Platanthera guangdongensis TaxID=2320717 RepID=A0ABR2LZ98_9ASPA
MSKSVKRRQRKKLEIMMFGEELEDGELTLLNCLENRIERDLSVFVRFHPAPTLIPCYFSHDGSPGSVFPAAVCLAGAPPTPPSPPAPSSPPTKQSAEVTSLVLRLSHHRKPPKKPSQPPFLLPEATSTVVEVQASASLPQSQTVESPIGGSAQDSPASSPHFLASSVEGPGSNGTVPVSGPPNLSSGPAEAVIVSPPTSSPAQKATHGTSSDSLQDHVRAKFVTSHGYVVPPPSFSYSVFPRVNSASGIHQQISSAPALKLTPSISPAALQPPVPGQPLGSRPSFSYNVVPLPNAPVPGQQFQLTTVTNQKQLVIGSSAPPRPLAATCLQPPASRQPIRPTVSSSATLPQHLPQNFPPPMQLPVPPPKGQLSPSTNFSFGGVSRPPLTIVASVKTYPSSTCTSDTMPVDAATTSTPTGEDSKLPHDMHTSSTSGSTISPISNSSNMLPPTGLLITGRPPIVGVTAINNPPEASNPTALHLTNTSSSLTTMRPIQNNQTFTTSNQSVFTNSTVKNVRPLIYPHFPSVSVLTPPLHAHWLPPPQTSGLQCPPMSQYPAVLPGPFPFPVRGMPPPSLCSPDVRPPGVSPEVRCEIVPASTTEPSFPVSKSGAGSPPPDAVIKKEVNDLQEDGNRIEELEAWTVHKTEAGVLYYYNTISGESTYERPVKFKGERHMPPLKPVIKNCMLDISHRARSTHATADSFESLSDTTLLFSVVDLVGFEHHVIGFAIPLHPAPFDPITCSPDPSSAIPSGDRPQPTPLASISDRHDSHSGVTLAPPSTIMLNSLSPASTPTTLDPCNLS